MRLHVIVSVFYGSNVQFHTNEEFCAIFYTYNKYTSITCSNLLDGSLEYFYILIIRIKVFTKWVEIKFQAKTKKRVQQMENEALLGV